MHQTMTPARCRIVLCYVGLGVLLAVPARVSARQPTDGARQLDFFIGHWDVTVRSIGPDGTVTQSKARTHAYPILDGKAIQDDWRSLDPTGNVIFRGTSIRTYIPSTGNWVVHWVMANVPGYTYIDAEFRDGILHGEGRGVDGGGAFKERYRYFDITPDGYSFEFERSYDGGTTWRKMTEFDAVRMPEPGDG